MSVNGSKLPVYHLKCVAPETQGGGAMKEEAPTQINDIRQYGILYQNNCAWQGTCVYHVQPQLQTLELSITPEKNSYIHMSHGNTSSTPSRCQGTCSTHLIDV